MKLQLTRSLLLSLALASQLPVAIAQEDSKTDSDTQNESTETESAESMESVNTAVENPTSEQSTQESKNTQPNIVFVSDGIESATNEDITSFKQSFKRYSQRMDEMREESLMLATLQKDAAQAEIKGIYERPLQQLSQEQIDNEKTAIQKFENFITKYPEKPQGAEIRFQLAEIYYKHLDEAFIAEGQKREALFRDQEQLLERLNSRKILEGETPELLSEIAQVEAELTRLEQLPRLVLDLTKPVKLYEEIVTKFPEASKENKVLDGALYMLGWSYSSGESNVYDEAKAIAYYTKLVEDFPESAFSGHANYQVGVYYFDLEERDKALTYFKNAVELTRPKEGEYDTIFENALFRLAWTYYLKDDFGNALSIFTQAMDYAERKKQVTGEYILTMEECVTYTAFSFTDLANRLSDRVLEMDEPNFNPRLAKPLLPDNFNPPNSNQKAKEKDFVSADGIALDYKLADHYYNINGERGYTTKIFAEMGRLLTEQKEFSRAIDVYSYMQKQWPLAPDNPVYQKRIADLYLEEGDEDQYFAMMQELTEVYAENGEWWIANRNNPSAQDIARQFIESSLLQVANNQFNKAYFSQDPEDYLKAARKFKQYLEKVPFAEDYYDAQWYMAESLLQAKAKEEALVEYMDLYRSRNDHHRGELAQLRVVNITNAFAYEVHNKGFVHLPDGVAVQQKELLSNGQERLIYQLHPASKQFIEMYNLGSNLDFAERIVKIEKNIEELQNLSPETEEEAQLIKQKIDARTLLITDTENGKNFFDERLKTYEYQVGQIYYAHGQFDQARESLTKVVEKWQDSEEATSAAALIISTYQTQLNWLKLRETAEYFASLGIQAPEGGDSFERLAQVASRNVIVEMTQKAEKLMVEGDVEAAIALFNEAALQSEQYLRDNPDLDVDTRADTLLRAGNNYEAAGNLEKANAVYRQYIDEFPSKDAARSLLFSIATNHQNALELEEAIKYFDILYNETYGKGIPYPDAISARFNAAILTVGLGRYQEAAERLEAYVNKFPNETDAEKVYYSAGEYWKEVADWRALEFYTRYLRKFKGSNPDNTIDAYYQRIEIYRGQNREREVNREWDALIKAYEGLVAQGYNTDLMRAYAAEYELLKLPEMLRDFRSHKYTNNDERNSQIVLDMNTELQEIKQTCESWDATFRDFEALIASHYCVGAARLHMANFLSNYPIPDTLSDNAYLVFEEMLNAQIEPLEAGGIKSLSDAIALSKKAGRWTKWTDSALAELAAQSPAEYPPEKQELKYSVQSQYVPNKGPMSLILETSNIIDVEDPNQDTEESEVEVPQNDIQNDNGTNSNNGGPVWGESNDGMPTPEDSDSSQETPEGSDKQGTNEENQQ